MGEHNPETLRLKRWRWALNHKYGSEADKIFDEMLIRQDGLCEICDLPLTATEVSVDHDHKTGEMRSLLCNDCNAGLGYFEESPRLLTKAAAYLLRFR